MAASRVESLAMKTFSETGSPPARQRRASAPAPPPPPAPTSVRRAPAGTRLRHRRHLRHSRVVAAGRPLLAVVLERRDDIVFCPGRRRAAGFAPGAARLAGLAPEPAPGSAGQPGLARRLFSRLARRHGVRAVPAKRQHHEPAASLEAEAVETPLQTPSQN